MTNLVIMGAGDCGKELIGFIKDINKVQNKYNILGFLDKKEKIGQLCGKYKVIGEDAELDRLHEKYGVHAVIAMQDGKIRKRIVESQPYFHEWETLIHPSATILESVTIGMGTIISPNVCVSVDTKIGEHCFFSIGASVGHDCEISDYSSFMPGAVSCGHVKVGECTYIATNASILPGIVVGKNVVLGVASVALEDIPDDVMVYGNPGRIMMKRK